MNVTVPGNHAGPLAACVRLRAPKLDFVVARTADVSARRRAVSPSPLGRDIYEPAADTWLLAGATRVRAGERVLEIGTGSGAVALHLARAGAHVTATDISPQAVAHARAAATREGLQIRFLVADLLEPVRGRFDVVIFNPPYLPTGPGDHVEGPLDLALDGGLDGLDVVRRFLRGLPGALAPGGRGLVVVSTLSPWDAFQAAVPAGWSARVVASDRFDFEEVHVVAVTPARGATRTGGSRCPPGRRSARAGTPRASSSGRRPATRRAPQAPGARRRGRPPRSP